MSVNNSVSDGKPSYGMPKPLFRVRDLIAALSQCDPDLPVYADEDGILEPVRGILQEETYGKRSVVIDTWDVFRGR